MRRCAMTVAPVDEPRVCDAAGGRGKTTALVDAPRICALTVGTSDEYDGLRGIVARDGRAVSDGLRASSSLSSDISSVVSGVASGVLSSCGATSVEVLCVPHRVPEGVWDALGVDAWRIRPNSSTSIASSDSTSETSCTGSSSSESISGPEIPSDTLSSAPSSSSLHDWSSSCTAKIFCGSWCQQCWRAELTFDTRSQKSSNSASDCTRKPRSMLGSRPDSGSFLTRSQWNERSLSSEYALAYHAV